MMIIRKVMGIGSYGTVRPDTTAPHQGAVLCGYLGCGQYATRTAWDRLYNMIYACPDTTHGRSVGS